MRENIFDDSKIRSEKNWERFRFTLCDSYDEKKPGLGISEICIQIPVLLWASYFVFFLASVSHY